MHSPGILSCPLPPALGATITQGGVDFAIISRHGERVSICLFDETAEREIARLPLPCRTGDIHHGFLPGAGAGLRYGLRCEGPWQPERGHRFDERKLLVDPHARRLDRPFRWDPALALPPAAAIDTAHLVPRAIVAAEPPPLARARREPTPHLIYELGVKAFSMRHPGVPMALRGTLPALREPAILAHLARLGVSHVELLPIPAWMDERHLPPLGLANAWGYNPVAFGALDPRLAPNGLADLIDLCAGYAEAGIGVVLDLVFNHSGESDEHGATVSLRGLDNALYYRHDAEGRLVNDTGCGNTLALDQPAGIRLVMDTLRRFRRCGVAGFRFDLATVMGRLPEGFSPDAPLLAAIAQDPELSGCLLIAEPWDLGPGGYQLGAFPAPFAEWNGRYKDEVRKFWRGDAGMAGALATRLAGSADLFQAGNRPPSASINYVTAHDGFTLADLVSHERKRNEDNGEDNRDGTDQNHSWNNGLEGPSGIPEIAAARKRDARALLANLFVSRGVPMLLAGDELGRTQDGNNNAYAQDNAAFWLDWDGADEDLIDFVAALSRLRREWPILAEDRWLTGAAEGSSQAPDVVWIDLEGRALDAGAWHGLDAFAMRLSGPGGSLLIAINRRREPTSFTLPPPPAAEPWRELAASVSLGRDEGLPPRSVMVFGVIAA